MAWPLYKKLASPHPHPRAEFCRGYGGLLGVPGVIRQLEHTTEMGWDGWKTGEGSDRCVSENAQSGRVAMRYNSCRAILWSWMVLKVPRQNGRNRPEHLTWMLFQGWGRPLKCKRGRHVRTAPTACELTGSLWAPLSSLLPVFAPFRKVSPCARLIFPFWDRFSHERTWRWTSRRSRI